MAKVSIPDQAQPITINRFYGENNTFDGYQNMKLGEATTCRNFRITPDLKLKKREGYATYLTSNDVTEKVMGMWSGVINGEFTHIVRFGNRVFASQDISGASYTTLTIGSNTATVTIEAFNPATAGTTAVDNLAFVLNKSGTQLTEVASGSIDNVASIGKFYYHTDKTIKLIVAKTDYSTLEEARTGLGTTRVYYYIGSV